MSTATLLSVLAVLASGPVVGRGHHRLGAAPGPEKTDCETQIKNEIIGVSGRKADHSCWRLGQVSLGMSHLEVRRLLGAPDYEGDAAKDPANPDLRYGLALYVFPRNLSASLAVEPVATARYRLLEVTYADDAVVRVDSHPPHVVSRSACRGADRRVGSDVDFSSAVGGFAPFEAFGSVHQGEPLADLHKKFGRTPDVDATRNRYSYSKTPLTFVVEPKSSRIVGFSLSSDPSKAAASGDAGVTLQRDPMTCLIRGYKVLPLAPGG